MQTSRHPRTLARQALRAITTLLLMLAGAVVLGYITATPARAADSWTGADKGKHAAAGALIAGSTLQLTGSERLALAAGTAAAVGKELIDMHRAGHTASYRDAAVTVVGAVFAVQAPGLLITPISVSYRITW